MSKKINDPHNPLINEQTADVVYLRYHLGYEYARVAEELGISEDDAQHIAVSGLRRIKELVFGS
jgi:DNA-directed RNA polymerase specialized sigma24 family protein